MVAGAPAVALLQLDVALLMASLCGAALRAEALPLGWRLLACAPDAAC